MGFPFSQSDLLWMLLTLPMRLICKAVGFEWNSPIADPGDLALQQIAASLLVNSALLGLIATPFGRFLKVARRT
jgi:hypothetical protein